MIPSIAMSRSARRLAAPFLLLLALLLVACGGDKAPEGWAQPIAAGDSIVYFPKKDRIALLAVDGGTGRETWRFPDKGLRPAERDAKFKATYDVAVDDTSVYFGAWTGRVYAISRTDGALRWELRDQIEGGLVGGPVLHEGRLIFGTTAGRLYVRNAADGTPAAGWPQAGLPLGSEVWAAPVVAGDSVIVATMGGRVEAFSLGDASKRWQTPFRAGGAVPELTLLAEGRLFVPSLNKKVAVLDTSTGQPLFPAVATEDWVWSRPAVADGVMYFGDFSGRVYALDITTGGPRWSPYDADASVKAGPAVIGSVLMVATREPAVHFIDLATGQRKNVVKLDDAGTVRASLLVRGSTAIVATTKGKIFQADPAKLSVVPIPIAEVRQ
jgi:outer membrane protein assembly factor BamB